MGYPFVKVDSLVLENSADDEKVRLSDILVLGNAAILVTVLCTKRDRRPHLKAINTRDPVNRATKPRHLRRDAIFKRRDILEVWP